MRRVFWFTSPQRHLNRTPAVAIFKSPNIAPAATLCCSFGSLQTSSIQTIINIVRSCSDEQRNTAVANSPNPQATKIRILRIFVCILVYMYIYISHLLWIYYIYTCICKPLARTTHICVFRAYLCDHARSCCKTNRRRAAICIYEVCCWRWYAASQSVLWMIFVDGFFFSCLKLDCATYICNGVCVGCLLLGQRRAQSIAGGCVGDHISRMWTWWWLWWRPTAANNEDVYMYISLCRHLNIQVYTHTFSRTTHHLTQRWDFRRRRTCIAKEDDHSRRMREWVEGVAVLRVRWSSMVSCREICARATHLATLGHYRNAVQSATSPARRAPYRWLCVVATIKKNATEN